MKREPAGTVAGITRSSWMVRRAVLLPPPRRGPDDGPAGALAADSLPLGRMSGRPFRPFSRAISAFPRRHLALEVAHPPKQLQQQSLQFRRRQTIKILGGRHRAREPDHLRQGNPQSPAMPGVLPRLREIALGSVDIYRQAMIAAATQMAAP